MASLNPEHIKAVIQLINQGPYFKHLSMPVRELGVGYAIVELKVRTPELSPCQQWPLLPR
ncbi:hypothetical protein KKI24_08805 [bacterium]|nr:hypothetical protein [bacterium]